LHFQNDADAGKRDGASANNMGTYVLSPQLSRRFQPRAEIRWPEQKICRKSLAPLAKATVSQCAMAISADLR
jgi:hypothetical protein